MGMFDWFRYTDPLPDGRQMKGDEKIDDWFQTKDFALGLLCYGLDENRRLVFADPPSDYTAWEPRIDDSSHEHYTGILRFVGSSGHPSGNIHCHDYVARVTDGVVGPVYTSWWAMREAEDARDRRMGWGKWRKGRRYIPKPKVKYVSKAQREKNRLQAWRDAGEDIGEHLYQSINRRGFARRFLKATS